jgi:hypothetical protein
MAITHQHQQYTEFLVWSSQELNPRSLFHTDKKTNHNHTTTSHLSFCLPTAKQLPSTKLQHPTSQTILSQPQCTFVRLTTDSTPTDPTYHVSHVQTTMAIHPRQPTLPRETQHQPKKPKQTNAKHSTPSPTSTH